MNESNEKQVVKKSVWDENMEAIRQTFGKDLTPTEFTMFVEMGKSLKLNPFNREIWCVKYGNQTPSIFVGRDGYRKNAQAQPDYNGHIKEAVYENDEFEIIEGRIKHKISFKNRGKLIGAYCEVYRKGIEHPFREMVRFDEYYSGHLNPDGSVKKRYDSYKKQYVDMKPTNWDTMPETMIKKVAEAQALRMAYQSVFAGTYDESERWDDTPENPPQKGRSQQKATQPPVNAEKAEDAEITGENGQLQTPIMDKKTKDFLNAMGKVKSDIAAVTGSDGEYYKILGSNGYNHANEIHDEKTMKSVYKELRAFLHDFKPSTNGGEQNA